MTGYWLIWRRGAARRRDTVGLAIWGVVVVGSIGAVGIPGWLLAVLAVAAGRGLVEHWCVPELTVLRLYRTASVMLAGHGFDGPLRLRWLDQHRVILSGPHRVIYRDECTPAGFAALRRMARGIELPPA